MMIHLVLITILYEHRGKPRSVNRE